MRDKTGGECANTVYTDKGKERYNYLGSVGDEQPVKTKSVALLTL